MDHSGSSCRGTTHPLISPPKANCPTHPKATWGLKYPMELNHIESCISVSTWIFGILWVFLHVYIYNMIKLICYRDDIFNICTTYIYLYIYFVYSIYTYMYCKSHHKITRQTPIPTCLSRRILPRRRGSPDRRAGRHGLFHFRFGGIGDSTVMSLTFFCCFLWKLMREGD